MEKKTVKLLRWQYVTMIVLGLQTVSGVAQTGVPPERIATNSASHAASVVNRTARPVTGHESMWGVVGAPTEAVLNMVNASPLMLSELDDYQDAVDAHTALPFDELHEDWSGAKMLMLSTGIKQIAISSDVLGEPPAEFVGDLSHGFGYFANYERDQHIYNSAMQSTSDEARRRMIAGNVGVMMEAHAEVNNYLVQQQIIDATQTLTQNPVIIKLANNEGSKGRLQSAFDKLSASDHKLGLTPEQNQAQLEKIAYAITGTIPVPRP